MTATVMVAARTLCCSQLTHAAIKATPVVWESLPLLGEQDDGDGGLVEVRLCDECGSSLAIEIRTDSDHGAESYVDVCNDARANARWSL